MDYVAKQLIWHSRQQRYYDVGEIVPLDHLQIDEVQLLVQAGIVANADQFSELERVNGVGTEYAKALARVGIHSLRELVEADSHALEAAIGVASVQQIIAWQAHARTLLQRADSAPENNSMGGE